MVGWKEILIIVVVVVILFGGAKRLPELAKSLGKAIKEFKKSVKAVEDDVDINDEKLDEEKKDEK